MEGVQAASSKKVQYKLNTYLKSVKGRVFGNVTNKKEFININDGILQSLPGAEV